MNVEQIKYHTCPYDDEDGILLVDAETENMPTTDRDGNLQYYCKTGRHTFSADEDDDQSTVTQVRVADGSAGDDVVMATLPPGPVLLASILYLWE